MKKVYQTKFGTDKNEPEKLGDCLLACIASILEIDIKEVPNFSNNEFWMLKYNQWLKKKYDLYIVWMSFENIHDCTKYIHGYHIITGKSRNYPKVRHAIVGKNGDPWFDPGGPKSKLIYEDLSYGIFCKIM